ncbi:MAG: hypothetical protein ACREP6_01340 [Candidatus Binataceae bacterium]
MVLLFYAFGREIGPLKRRFERRRPLTVAGLRGFHANIDGLELTAVATGIGTSMARRNAQIALEAIPGAELAISAGVAGALSPGLAVGDIVIASRVIEGGRDGAFPERIVEIEQRRVEILQALLNTAGLAVSSGGILTSPRILATGLEKRQARQETGAIAVDMESAAIGLEAAAKGVPFVCVRSVMDEIDHEIAGAGFVDANGRVRPFKAAGEFIRQPSAILRVPWMVRNLALATRTLADAVEAILNSAE